jgi:hypothetical protein
MKTIISLVLAVALLLVAGAPVIVASVSLGGLAQADTQGPPPPSPPPPGPCPGESQPPCNPPPGPGVP